MTTEAIAKQFGYRAVRDGSGVLTIKAVPIFVECSRGDTVFDKDWISTAVLKAKQAEAEGYLPPLHVRHHEAGPDDQVRAAGFFRIVGTKTIRFKGEDRMAVLADLVITDSTVEQEILQKRLPYRSVEIFDVNKPAIDSLALLDHEAPYLELPMLMISQLTDAPNANPIPVVAHATFANPWLRNHSTSDAGLVACFRRGRSAHLFYEDIMTTKYFEKDEKKDSEKMADGAGVDVSAVVKAIEDGSISVADMEAILAAIAATKGGEAEVAPEAEMADETKGDDPTKMEDDAPASAPVPGENMAATSELLSKMARLRGEVEATKARLNERDAMDRRNSDVAEALKKLEDRPMGANLEQRLHKFHKEHGAAAFSAYVDGLTSTFASLGGHPDRAVAAFASQTAPASEVAMAYVSKGTDAVTKAAQFSREWHDLRERGFARMSEERYVALNMEKHGVSMTSKN